MLTTYDNPFDPFTEFAAWWKEDLLLGHDCCGLLARTANVSSILPDYANEADIIDAMDRIVAMEPMVYKKVSQEKPDERLKKLKNPENYE